MECLRLLFYVKNTIPVLEMKILYPYISVVVMVFSERLNCRDDIRLGVGGTTDGINPLKQKTRAGGSTFNKFSS